jgi:DNA-binding beta-propeller fold protein YncE
VKVFTLKGELLSTLGSKGRPGEGGAPFNRPTNVAIAPSGEMYVSDGYGNSRVHKFSRGGELLLSWGAPGNGPGQFSIPHGVWVDGDDRVLVTDRQNNRIQVFDSDGEFLTQWTGLRRPCTVFIDRDDNVYVAELESRMSILNSDGELLARWGGTKSAAPGQFVAPHCAWVDSRGDLYVGEVLEGQRIQKFERIR